MSVYRALCIRCDREEPQCGQCEKNDRNCVLPYLWPSYSPVRARFLSCPFSRKNSPLLSLQTHVGLLLEWLKRSRSSFKSFEVSTILDLLKKAFPTGMDLSSAILHDGYSVIDRGELRMEPISTTSSMLQRPVPLNEGDLHLLCLNKTYDLSKKAFLTGLDLSSALLHDGYSVIDRGGLKMEPMSTTLSMLQRPVPLSKGDLYLLRLSKTYGLGRDVLQCIEKPPDQMENISTTLDTSWIWNPTAKSTATVSLQWPLLQFLKSQFTDAPSQKQRFGSIITLTGSTTDALAVTVDQYLSQTWPEIASKILKLLPETLDSQINHSRVKTGTLRFNLLESSQCPATIPSNSFPFGFGFVEYHLNANLKQSLSRLGLRLRRITTEIVSLCMVSATKKR